MRFQIHSCVPAFLISLLIVGCASAPRPSAIHYSPPSVAPVRTQISDAQTLSGKARTAIAKAQSFVGPSSVDPANVPQLHEALDESYGAINDLTTKLDGAQKSVDVLEKAVGIVTARLNTANDDKNAALDREAAQKKASARIEKKYHRLKLGVCSLVTALVCFLAIKLGLLKLISKLALLGPWGIAGAAAASIALPGIVFAVLWAVL
jgi:hypothetical protein